LIYCNRSEIVISRPWYNEEHQKNRICKQLKTKYIGRYIVTDPKICHGKPTFRGTRILVADVLEQVADGLAWETIFEEWRGSISREAIAEAVRFSRRAFLENADKYALGPMAA
jgi:uncharacterized protein (DUF433 family)